jgi:hypothetical protein
MEFLNNLDNQFKIFEIHDVSHKSKKPYWFSLETMTGTQLKLVRVSNFEELEKTCPEYKVETTSLKGIPEYPKNPIPLIVVKQTRYCIRVYLNHRRGMSVLVYVSTMEELLCKFPNHHHIYCSRNGTVYGSFFKLNDLSQLKTPRFHDGGAHCVVAFKKKSDGDWLV